MRIATPSLTCVMQAIVIWGNSWF